MHQHQHNPGTDVQAEFVDSGVYVFFFESEHVNRVYAVPCCRHREGRGGAPS